MPKMPPVKKNEAAKKKPVRKPKIAANDVPSVEIQDSAAITKAEDDAKGQAAELARQASRNG